MKKTEVIFESESHKWIMITRDPSKLSYVIDTNEYLIINKEQKGFLIDPGGLEIFPVVFGSISRDFSPDDISHIFSSHQDPDIISSISLWLEVNPKIQCYISWLWTSFVPHFGGDSTTYIPIPDEGMEIQHGNVSLTAVPAHYLHSSGNFNLYDKVSNIFFSGDIGSALLPADHTDIYVSNFDSHIKMCEKFHKRWMGSERAKKKWCERVSSLKVDMLCPQHGSIFAGKDVDRFVNWFSDLEIGMA
jgi:flavorubredoxin